MGKVVVFGSLNMDLSVECDAFPQAGETVLGRGFVSTPGGKGANQAVAAARMGATTHMVGAVGKDSLGTKMLQSLVDSGVLLERVQAMSNVHTGTATIVRSHGENRIVVDPGANALVQVDQVCHAIEDLEGEGNVFLTQLECNLATTLDSIAYAKEFGFYTILNAAPACELPSDIYQFVDLICVNEVECEALTGISPDTEKGCTHALMKLSARGVKTVIITLGSRGSVALSGDEMTNVSGFEVKAVDSTGAGDAYLGALAACVASGSSVEGSMRFASAAGALAATRVGAQAAMPTRSEVEAFLVQREQRDA